MLCGLKLCLVHGGIRHLENNNHYSQGGPHVHGGIRHLEIMVMLRLTSMVVHGGIRHLENKQTLN